jgi:hypothetical protein
MPHSRFLGIEEKIWIFIYNPTGIELSDSE